MVSQLKVNEIVKQSGSNLTIGGSGDNIVLGSGATAAFGKIGQVIEATNGSMTTNITSTSYVDTGLTASLTPSSTSSKVLITINWATTMDGGNNGTLGFGAIYHNDTTNLRERLAVYDTDFGNVGPACSVQTLHSPSSTSSQKYNLYAKTLNASSQFRPNGTGSIILMEILP